MEESTQPIDGADSGERMEEVEECMQPVDGEQMAAEWTEAYSFTEAELALFSDENFPRIETKFVSCHAKNVSNMLTEIGSFRKIFSRDYYTATHHGIRRFRLHVIHGEDNVVTDYVLSFLGMRDSWENEKVYRGDQHLVHWAYSRHSMFHPDHEPTYGYKMDGTRYEAPEEIDAYHEGCEEISHFLMVCDRMSKMTYENVWLSAIARTNSPDYRISSCFTDERCLFNDLEDASETIEFNRFVEWLLRLNEDSASYLRVVKYTAMEDQSNLQRINADEMIYDTSILDDAAVNSRSIMDTLKDMDDDCMLGVQMNLYNGDLDLCHLSLFYPFLVMRRAGLQVDTRSLTPLISPYFCKQGVPDPVDLTVGLTFKNLMNILVPRKDRVDRPPSPPTLHQTKN